VDLVSSGNTLKANHLKAVELISDISSRLVVNQAALKMKHDAIQPLLDKFAKAINK
jgi:ATP phosphoribosyltransferase